MPSRDNEQHLRDILESVELIEAFTADMELAGYKGDILRRSAVERQMQIITEAAKRLGDDAYALCPNEDWKGFCRMGDVLRHGYHKVDDEIVWNTIKDELPPMKEAILKALRPRVAPEPNRD